MRCEDAHAMLIEGEGGEQSAALRAHVAMCAACQAYARDMEGLRAGFRALAAQAAPEPSWGFAARLVRRLDELEEKSRGADFLEQVGRRVVYAAGLLTLLLLLALVLPASSPLRGPTTSELYWAQADTAVLTNYSILPDETLAGRELNSQAPGVNGAEGKR
jgi:hypothetical protein